MALAVSVSRESRARSMRIHSASSPTSGATRVLRAARRPPTDRPLISRSIAKDRVDAAHGFERQRRLCRIGEHKELAPAMAPAGCFGDRRGTAPGLVELSEPGIGIGLQDACISGEVTC